MLLSDYRIHEIFKPYDVLAKKLISKLGFFIDGSHDISHLLRVWSNVRKISQTENCLSEIVLASTLLHDCIIIEKNDANRYSASKLSADHASKILKALSWEQDKIDKVHHAILAHSYSADIKPETLEACILQDADRLDAIGAIGIARCFYISGRIGTSLYDVEDPKAQSRTLNDHKYALDHFQAKLLNIVSGFHTETARIIAHERHQFLLSFFKQMIVELS